MKKIKPRRADEVLAELTKLLDIKPVKRSPLPSKGGKKMPDPNSENLPADINLQRLLLWLKNEFGEARIKKFVSVSARQKAASNALTGLKRMHTEWSVEMEIERYPEGHFLG